MIDPVARGLRILADGLRPYVQHRAERADLDPDEREPLEHADVQALLVFMWSHWHVLFQGDLGHAERSLLSELREYRNRWAHQHEISERDTYRILDDIERLLTAVDSPLAPSAGQLRIESLKRLSDQHHPQPVRSLWKQSFWPLLVCLICAIAIDATVLSFSTKATAIFLTVVITLAISRMAYLMVRRVEVGIGPRECRNCGRVVYTPKCPYCESEHAMELLKVKTDSPHRRV